MLVRPVSDESHLVQLDALPQSALRPEFRDVCTADRCCESASQSGIVIGFAESHVYVASEDAAKETGKRVRNGANVGWSCRGLCQGHQ